MKTTHTKQKKESKEEISKRQIWAKKKIFIDSLIIFSIAISPFLAYLYLYVPEGDSWTTAFFTVDKNGFSSVNIAIWIYSGKIIPLYLLIFWFLTCKHWWYHIIIVPITLYAFQLFTVLNKKADFIDENEIVWVITVLMIIAPFVYLIRLRLYDRLVLGIDLKKIDAELEEYDRKEKEAKNKIETK
ncbi:hypothetical protein [Kordia sp.]|uniref:hypothetical protein n=1 Tax=Kordia sp. TaxID=1965332 RepID=UPI003D6BD783